MLLWKKSGPILASNQSTKASKVGPTMCFHRGMSPDTLVAAIGVRHERLIFDEISLWTNKKT
jgi:hypothetical protein